MIKNFLAKQALPFPFWIVSIWFTGVQSMPNIDSRLFILLCTPKRVWYCVWLFTTYPWAADCTWYTSFCDFLWIFGLKMQEHSNTEIMWNTITHRWSCLSGIFDYILIEEVVACKSFKRGDWVSSLSVPAHHHKEVVIIIPQ